MLTIPWKSRVGEEGCKSFNFWVTLQPFHLSCPGVWCCIPVMQALGRLGRCERTVKQKHQETPWRSSGHTLQFYSPSLQPHQAPRQPKPGLLQALRGAQQWLHWVHPLAPLSITHLICPFSHRAAVRFEFTQVVNLKHWSISFGALLHCRRTLWGFSCTTCYIQQSNRCRSSIQWESSSQFLLQSLFPSSSSIFSKFFSSGESIWEKNPKLPSFSPKHFDFLIQLSITKPAVF